MRSPLLLLAVGALMWSATACQHITTNVPGVLDMRSDGSAAQADSTASGAERTGFDGIMNGDGVKTAAGGTQVVDRKYWVCGLFPVINDSATEEINAAMGSSGAMRNVRIGEQYTVLNWFMAACVNAIPVVNIVGIVMPPRDFHFWGTRIKPESGPAPAAPIGDAASPAAPPASVGY